MGFFLHLSSLLGSYLRCQAAIDHNVNDDASTFFLSVIITPGHIQSNIVSAFLNRASGDASSLRSAYFALAKCLGLFGYIKKSRFLVFFTSTKCVQTQFFPAANKKPAQKLLTFHIVSRQGVTLPFVWYEGAARLFLHLILGFEAKLILT